MVGEYRFDPATRVATRSDIGKEGGGGGGGGLSARSGNESRG